MNSFFSSQQAKKEMETLYQQKLDELPTPYELLKVETSFGDTIIVLTGQKNLLPLVLLHGLNGCAPMALEVLIELSKCYRIYAVDVVGQPNLSAEVRPERKDDSYSQWMFEILARLNVWEAVLVGFSFGGFISWKALAFDGRRIAKACLISPAGIVKGNYRELWWKVLRPMQLFTQRDKVKHIQQVADALFTERDAFAIQYLSVIMRHYQLDLSPVPLITRMEAERISVPVYLIASDHDLLFPGRSMIKWARALFPSLREAVLLKDSKHFPGRAGNRQITDFLTKLAG